MWEHNTLEDKPLESVFGIWNLKIPSHLQFNKADSNIRLLKTQIMPWEEIFYDEEK